MPMSATGYRRYQVMANNRLILRNKVTREELVLAIAHVGMNEWAMNQYLTLDRLQAFIEADSIYPLWDAETDLEITTELAQAKAK
jgi:hypothetical protein